MTKRIPLLPALAILALAIPALAQEDKTDVGALLEKVAALEARIGELEADRAAAPANLLETEINALSEGSTYRADEMSTRWANTTRHSSEDKAFDLKFGGRIMTDFVFGTQNDDFENSFGPVGNYIEFRRARLYVAGTIYTNAFFKIQFDFAGDGLASFKDVYIGLKNIPVVGTIMVGHFFMPVSLEQQTSSKYIDFLERAMPVEAFSPERQTGIMIKDTALEDDRLFWAVAVYREGDSTGDAIDDDIGAGHDGEWNFAIRLAFVAWEDEGGARMLQVGGSFNYRNPDDGVVRFRSRPEIHTPQGRIVDTNNGTGDIVDADDVLLFQFEIALVLNSFSAQAEFFYATVDSTASGDPDFWGAYVFVSYFLTGEHRPYKKSDAAFSRVKPMNNFGDEGSGAWEIALRFSYIDLEDEAVTGGEAWDLTAGVNWYINPNTILKFNYVYSDASDGPADGVSHWFGFRLQIDF